MKRILVVVLLVALAMPSALGLTASIGNARMILNTDVVEGKPTVLQKSVKVNNVNNISVEVTISPQGDISTFTTVLDNKFVLAPGESKDARFVMTLDYGGKYEGKIMVGFKASDPSVKSTPVGLASTVIVIATGPANPNPPKPDTATNSTTHPIGPTRPVPANTNPTNTNPANSNPTGNATGEQPTGHVITNQQTVAEQSQTPSPFIGILIVFVVLVLGALGYWWYMTY